MRITFSAPPDMDHILLKARYQRLWKAYGAAITASFEKVTGAPFLRGVKINLGIKEIDENWSHSGSPGEEAIHIFHTKNSELEEELLWSLCHELAHRLLSQHKLVYDPRALGFTLDRDNYESHRDIFVFLIDVIGDAFEPELAAAILRFVDAYYLDRDDSGNGLKPTNNHGSGQKS